MIYSMKEILIPHEGGEFARPQSPVERLVNGGFSDPQGNLTEKAKLSIGRSVIRDRLDDVWEGDGLLVWPSSARMTPDAPHAPHSPKTLNFCDNSTGLTIVSQWKDAQGSAEVETPHGLRARLVTAFGGGAITGSALAGYMSSGNPLIAAASGVIGAVGAAGFEMGTRSLSAKEVNDWLTEHERNVRALLSGDKMVVTSDPLLPEASTRGFEFSDESKRILPLSDGDSLTSYNGVEAGEVQQERVEQFWGPILNRFFDNTAGDRTHPNGSGISKKGLKQLTGPISTLEYMLNNGGLNQDDVWEPLRNLLHVRKEMLEEMTDLRDRVNAAYRADSHRVADWEAVKLYVSAPAHFKDEIVKRPMGAVDFSQAIKVAADDTPARLEMWQKYEEEAGRGLPAPHEILDQKYQQAWFDFVDAITLNYHQDKADRDQSELLRKWDSVSERVALTKPSDVEDDLYVYRCREELLRAMSGLERTQENIRRVEEALEIINDMPEMLAASSPQRLYEAFHKRYGEKLGMATPDEFEEQYLQL